MIYASTLLRPLVLQPDTETWKLLGRHNELSAVWESFELCSNKIKQIFIAHHPLSAQHFPPLRLALRVSLVCLCILTIGVLILSELRHVQTRGVRE